MGQDQVSGGVSVLCWLAAPVAMFYGNLQNLVIRSKSVIKSSSVIGSQIGVMSDQLRVSLYMAMSQNVMKHLGEGDFIMFDEIPLSTIKLSEGRFQTFHDLSLSEELRWKSRRPKNKTFIRGANPGIPYELRNKNPIGWRRLNIATQERKVCDMEVEIVWRKGK